MEGINTFLSAHDASIFRAQAIARGSVKYGGIVMSRKARYVYLFMPGDPA